MEESQKDVAIRVFANQAKKYFRDSLVLQKVSEILREDVPAFADIVADTRKLHEIEVQAALFEAAIDAKIPPTVAQRLEEEVQKMLAALAVPERPM